MADLKLNDELSLISPSNVKIKNIKGNVRYVGYGRTDPFSLSSSTWTQRYFNTSALSFDDNYMEVYNGNALRIKKAGLYLFLWHQRAVDSSTSQCSQVRFSCDTTTDTDFGCWGGGVYRNTLHGNWIRHLSVGDYIYTQMYSEGKAITANPLTVWVFAIEGSENL